MASKSWILNMSWSVSLAFISTGLLIACGEAKWRETRGPVDPIAGIQRTPAPVALQPRPQVMPIQTGQPLYTSSIIPGRVDPRVPTDVPPQEGDEVYPENQELELVDAEPTGPNNDYLLVRAKSMDSGDAAIPPGPRYVPIEYLSVKPLPKKSQKPPKRKPKRQSDLLN